jgi:hypothetical protein
MKTAIMQPYLFPYLGYFQLVHSVDLFVCCDNMQYTKKGWINRNRYLNHHKTDTFTLPLKDAPQKNHIVEREIAPGFEGEKLLSVFEHSYRKSPCFSENFGVIREILLSTERNLFAFLESSIQKICGHLGIKTTFGRTSQIPIDHTKQKEEKVIEMCRALNTSTYINSSGGRELYSKENFKNHGITLGFLVPHPFEYRQFQEPFTPWLSIVDVLMFNPVERIRRQLNHYEIE